MNNSDYLFTSAFLKKFFQNCHDSYNHGTDNANQRGFLTFFEDNNGDIFYNESLNNIEHPKLRRVLANTGPNNNYKPYQKASEQEKEEEAIEKYRSLFTETYDDVIKRTLSKTLLKAIFNTTDIENKWNNKIFDLKIETKKNATTTWKTILSPFDLLPTKNLIIYDNFISIKNYEKNLLPILEYYKESFYNTKNKISIHIILAFSKKHGRTKKEEVEQDMVVWQKPIREVIEPKVRMKFNSKSNLEIHPWILYHDDKLKEHDRRIITDYYLINIPAGIDILNENNVTIKNTESKAYTVFNKRDLHIYNERKNILEGIIEKYKNHVANSSIIP